MTPYSNWLFIEPVQNLGVVERTLNCYAKVLAIGPDVKDTVIGDYVVFEKWDMPDVLINEKVYHFLRESDAMSKVPESLI